jgi:hypothetical protein
MAVMCASPGQAGRVTIARRSNGGEEICEKKQDFEARLFLHDAEIAIFAGWDTNIGTGFDP